MVDLTLEEIVRRCQEEALHQNRSDETGYCFELFRRALEDGDDDAWTAIQQQYRRLMLQWSYAAQADYTQEEAEDITREALERFWRTLRTVHISERFAHVGALLRYLQQCVISTVQDHRRRAERKQRLMTRLKHAENLLSLPMGPEQAALENILQMEQIRQVRTWIQAHVTDPQERLVLTCSFEDDLKPAEIAARHADVFTDAQMVRQIKERILKRLRRHLMG